MENGSSSTRCPSAIDVFQKMKKGYLALIFSIACFWFSFPLPVRSQGSDLNTLNSLKTRFSALFEQQKYAEAIPPGEQIVYLIERTFGPNNIHFIVALQNLAVAHVKIGNHQYAEPLLTRLISVAEHIPDSNKTNVVILAMTTLSDIAFKRKQYEEAELQLERALAFAEQASGECNGLIPLLLKDMAAVSLGFGEYEEAESYLKRSLPLYEKGLGPYHPDTITVIGGLSKLYEWTRENDRALGCRMEEVERNKKAFGLDSTQVAESLRRMADLNLSLADYSGAASSLFEALRIIERKLGKDHPVVGKMRRQLAGIYESLALLYDGFGLRKQGLSFQKVGQSFGKSASDSNGPLVTIPSDFVELVAEYQAKRGAAVFSQPETPSPFDENGHWEKIGGQGVNGSWGKNPYEKTKALAVHDGRLYAGLAGPFPDGAQVWSFDGGKWWKNGGGGTNGSWSGFPTTDVLLSTGDGLYCGIGGSPGVHNAEVWEFKEGRWRRVGGMGIEGAWQPGQFHAAYSMAQYKGALYVGMRACPGVSPGVFRFKNGKWEKVAGESSRLSWKKGQGYNMVYELYAHSDGYLYAGMSGGNGGGDVWRFDGETWEQVGGDGLRGSWINPRFTMAVSFTSYQQRLMVQLLNPDLLFKEKISCIWSFDGTEWKPLSLQSTPEIWKKFDDLNFLLPYKGHLYAGAGGRPMGNASIWELSGNNQWREVAGHGKFGSWGVSGTLVPKSYGYGNKEYVYRMAEYKGSLVAGFGMRAGAAQIWQYVPGVH